MEFLLIPGAIVFAGYLISKEIRRSKKNSANQTHVNNNNDNINMKVKNKISLEELERLKEIGNKYYQEALEEGKKDLEEFKKKLTDNDSTLTEEMIKEHIDSTRNLLKTLTSTKENFSRLEERYIHSPIEVKHTIYQDWFNFGYYFHEVKNLSRDLDYIFDSKLSESIFEEIREFHLKAEEIEKRFVKLLKE